MVDADPLALSVRDVRDQVTRVKESLEAMSRFNDGVYERVQGHLTELIEHNEELLGEVESGLNGGADGEASVRLRIAREEARTLFRESFAFVEGALSREAGLDGGFCQLADKLLNGLSEQAGKLNWRGLTILAETSFFGEPAEVIRLKFPELSIWHLPVAAHEFGHFANSKIPVKKTRQGGYWGTKYPVEALLDRKLKRDPKSWFHAHEFLADIFAVYAIGPAYAYSSLLLRPDPGAVRGESPYHPSWDERYFVIVETLQRIASHGGASQAIAEDIADRWAGVRAASPGGEVGDVKSLRRMLMWFYSILDGNLRGVRYATFVNAQQLVPALSDGSPLPSLAGFSMADVLNAAWLARIGDLGDMRRTAAIEQQALAACKAV